MVRSGGRSYVSSPPAFSNDGKRILVCSSNSVSIFSVTTGMQIASLEGHNALVTSVMVVPPSTRAARILCFCWTSSLDGTIRYWDFAVPELMKTIDIHVPIFSMVIPFFLDRSLVNNEQPQDAYLSIVDMRERTYPTWKKKPNSLPGQVVKCSLTKSRLRGGALIETEQPEFITVSPSGKFFGIRNKCKVHIWKVFEEEHVAKKITLHHTRSLTVLAFHPTQRIVAAGDVTGRILVWRGFGNHKYSVGDQATSGSSMRRDEERPGLRGDDDADSCTTWHWHSTEVSVLSFSSDGAYLYSGGKEGVLVVWQLDSGKRKYLPRIGSSLLYFTVSPDPLLSSISCADNQIHILKMPSMEISKTISGIKLPCSFPEEFQAPHNEISFDQNAGLAALRTENYCIQLYSLFDDRGISEVQVCERNHQPGEDITVVVTMVVLSIDGSIMSTVETRTPEDGIGGLVCLKFWASDLQNKKFTLSTIIYEPHRSADISSIAFHPTKHVAVSSSYGGDFKIWKSDDEIPQNDQASRNSGWMCHAVGSYKKKPMTAAAYSADGSVLAVAAETVITLWDPEQNVLVAVVGKTAAPIVTLCFAGNTECLMSVSKGSRPQLSVWSMPELSVSWSYKLHIEAITSAIDSSSFAVLALLPESSLLMEWPFQGRDGIILLFNVNDHVPVATWCVRKAKGGALSFLKGSQSSMEQNNSDEKSHNALLVYVNADHEYAIFDPYSNEATDLSVTRRDDLVALEESDNVGYKSIYGELPELDVKKNNALWTPSVPSQRPWETVFGTGSSHNLPPLTKLCSVFLESLLERRTATAE